MNTKQLLSYIGDTEPNTIAFHEDPGNHAPTSCTTPEDCFSLFFNSTLWNFLVTQTNKYAEKKISEMQVCL